MKVAVVVPAHNEEENIGKCLESIVNQEEKPDEIIVVDNNCTDKTEEIAKSFGARVVKEKNQGMIQARNAGFDAANFEIIARTDADAILPPNWISKIKEQFKDPNLGAISGPASYFSIPILSTISKLGNFLVFSGEGLLFGHPMLAGPNMALRKTLWEKIKKDVCLSDKEVHEDNDISIHLSKVTKIKYAWSFDIRTTRTRWIKIFTEYIVRLIKMFISHRIIKSGSGPDNRYHRDPEWKLPSG